MSFERCTPLFNASKKKKKKRDLYHLTAERKLLSSTEWFYQTFLSETHFACANDLHRINPSQSVWEDWHQWFTLSNSYEVMRNSLWSLQGLYCRLQEVVSPVDSPQNCISSSCIPSPGSPGPQRLPEGTVDGCFPTKVCADSLEGRNPQEGSPVS